MRTIISVTTILTIFASHSSLAQGTYEANPEQAIEIQRSSEYKAEGKEFKKVWPVTLEYNTSACKADLSLEYYQKGTSAHVRSTLHNEDCGASSGNYTVRVQFKDASGGTQLLEFDETWQRDDDSDVTSEKDYFIGDDIDIWRIKSRNLSCRCIEPESNEQALENAESQ